MGSIIAQDVFQQNLDAIFLSVPGVTGIANDMIIYENNRSWTWWKSPELSGSLQKEQSDTESR